MRTLLFPYLAGMDGARLSQAGLLRLALGRGMADRAALAASHLANDVLLLRSCGVPVVLPDELRVLLTHTSASEMLSHTHPVIAQDPHRDLAWTIACLLEGTRKAATEEDLVARLRSHGWSTAGDERAVVHKALGVAVRRYSCVRVEDGLARWAETFEPQDH